MLENFTHAAEANEAQERIGVLLVDGVAERIAGHEVALTSLNINIFKAETIDAALAVVARHEVAVMLIDAELAGLGALHLADRVRGDARHNETAIILISAGPVPEADRIKIFEAGMADYLSGPVSPAILRARVSLFVELYRRGRSLQSLNAELAQRLDARAVELKAAMGEQMLLAREVEHRAKNAMAVIQSIVRLTRAPTVETYGASIEGRIQAVARAHSLLSLARWRGVDLQRLMEEELGPFDRISRSGCSITLKPHMVQAVALALHELAINATRFGALSVPAGRVTVACDIKNEGVDIIWIEQGGPPAREPEMSGFGMAMFRSIAQHSGGGAELKWLPAGLHCTLTIGTAQLETAAESSAGVQ